MLTIKTTISAVLVAAVLFFSFSRQQTINKPDAVVIKNSSLLISINGNTFRDLNKNGKMDVYEDESKPVEDRVTDLLKQMSLDEKAGIMFINGTVINDDGSIEKNPNAQGFAARLPAAPEMMNEKKMNHFNYWQSPAPDKMAIGYNNLQKAAEKTRLGIPVTIASDPRNHFTNQVFALSAANTFSQWCEPLGLAAIGDSMFAYHFADVTRQEYIAVGIRESLHPQIDLSTEPRWPRISGTFGEDARLSAKMAAAYIYGYQGNKLSKQSVATMTKHFPGGGPQKEGLDPHFPFQKGQVYPGKNFDYHLIPFEAAFKAGTAAIMPYYGVPMEQTSENVGMSFNKDIITGLLRNKYHYDGVVCTDWGLITDAQLGPNLIWPARAWGVEKLSAKERIKKCIDAGIDQFGGENCPEYIIQLVKENKVTEARIDSSVRRLLRVKFELGLFDNPFVDEDVSKVFNNKAFKAAADSSQRMAMTLLKNENKILPLAKSRHKIYLYHVDSSVAAQYGTIVSNLKDADIAIVRLNTPFVPVNYDNFLAKMFHHGDLDFKEPLKDSILDILKAVPTVVDIYLDRPAVIPEVNSASKALLGDFGASDAAVLDVVFGVYKPMGHLPFELPSSMEEVRNQKEDVPYDSKEPLYKFGYGLSY